MSDRKPAYWAVLPAKVRYDTSLRPNAKLLYAEITALAGASGYCWATNEYLAQLFGIAARTVTDLVAQLAKCGYIRVEIVRDEKTNEVQQRRIWVDFSTPQGMAGLPDPIAKNGDTPIAENGGTPIAKNGEENNTREEYILPPKAPQGGRRRRSPKREPEWKPERFAKFWDFYRENVRSEDRLAAVRAWDKLKPDDALIERIGKALMVQIESPSWKEGYGKPYASTYLNNERWTDVSQMPKGQSAQPSSCWDEDPEVM